MAVGHAKAMENRRGWRDPAGESVFATRPEDEGERGETRTTPNSKTDDATRRVTVSCNIRTSSFSNLDGGRLTFVNTTGGDANLRLEPTIVAKP